MLQKILPVSGILVFAILSGTVSDLSSISANIKSNLIVLTGTLTCCIISYPPSLFTALFESICRAFSKDKKDLSQIIDEIENLSRIKRSKGAMALDAESKKIDNDFLKMGVEMVVDGYDRYTIFKTLERRYDSFLSARRSQAELVNTMVKLMPVFGFVGTIIGLINVLHHMGSPEMIGKGVALALLTTFYGLLYANVLALPMSKKITEQTRQDSIKLALIIEGIMDISDNVNSKLIRYRLRYCIGEFFQDDSACAGVSLKTQKNPKEVPEMKLSLEKEFVR